jgi:hypothetical protein
VICATQVQLLLDAWQGQQISWCCAEAAIETPDFGEQQTHAATT